MKRFNNLKAALKLLRPLAGGDAVDLADTSPLGFYQAVASGKKEVNYPDRAEGSKPKELILYALTPFGTPAADAPKLIVTVSKRSETNLTAAGLAITDLKIVKTAEVLEAATDAEGFIPAKVTVRVAGTTETEKTSKLTGRKYKTKGGDSYTFPFGLDTAALTEGQKARKAAIAKKVKTATRSASFTPERI
jgi:hypothetical protein